MESGSTSYVAASVMEATAALTGTTTSSGDPLVRVKVHSTGAVVDLPRSSISQLPARAFLPGEQVRRAMWSGAEEDATVRARSRPPPKALRDCSRAARKLARAARDPQHRKS